jgi:hypothetical protein
MSQLKGASFNRADIEQARFVNADLRSAKLTFTEGKIPGDYRRTYVETKFTGKLEKDLSIKNSSIAQPDFTCADLSNSDFSGFPLFGFISAKAADYFATPLFVTQPTFIRSKLDGADFRHIRQFGSIQASQTVDTVGQKDIYHPVEVPFQSCGGASSEVEWDGKRFVLYEYSICDSIPGSNDLSRFNTSLDFIFRNLGESTWMNANFPPGMLDALKARAGAPTRFFDVSQEPPPTCRPPSVGKIQ